MLYAIMFLEPKWQLLAAKQTIRFLLFLVCLSLSSLFDANKGYKHLSRRTLTFVCWRDFVLFNLFLDLLYHISMKNSYLQPSPSSKIVSILWRKLISACSKQSWGRPLRRQHDPISAKELWGRAVNDKNIITKWEHLS